VLQLLASLDATSAQHGDVSREVARSHDPGRPAADGVETPGAQFTGARARMQHLYDLIGDVTTRVMII
jgi:hypothetical protein